MSMKMQADIKRLKEDIESLKLQVAALQSKKNSKAK